MYMNYLLLDNCAYNCWLSYELVLHFTSLHQKKKGGGGRRGRMVIGFRITDAISAYRH